MSGRGRQFKFREELQYVINRCGMESGSNTPDFILAEYLSNCLIAFDCALSIRDKWHEVSGRFSSNNIRIKNGKGK